MKSDYLDNSFLLGIEGKQITTANVRPVLFGNKENDLAFVCDAIFYVMTESQATICPNISYRLLEYITAGLRSTVDSEQLLYSRQRVYFPIPKLYLLQTGLEMKEKYAACSKRQNSARIQNAEECINCGGIFGIIDK